MDIKSITAKLDAVANKIEKENPRIAIAIDRISDHLETIIGSSIKPQIDLQTKKNYGRALTYVVSDHKEPLKILTGKETLLDWHIEVLQEMGFKFLKEGVPHSPTNSGKDINPKIEIYTKSNYGGNPLTYVKSDHKELLKDLTGAKTLSGKHIKALKDMGFIFEEVKK